MDSIQFRDPELEGSFSFSCHDFNSSVTILTDGVCSDSDDESFIEIVLEPASAHHRDDANGDADDRREAQEELELRISFSSAAPFPEQSSFNDSLSDAINLKSAGADSETVTPSSSSSSSSSSSLTSSSSVETYWSAPAGTKPARLHETVKQRIQFPAVNRLLNTFLSNARALTETGDKAGSSGNRREVRIQNNQWELVRSRKVSNATKRRGSGLVMKFLMKFKSKNIRTLLASLVKPQQIVSPPQGSKVRKKAADILQTPSDKCLAQKEQGKNKNSTGKKLFGNVDRSRALEINLDAVRGVIEAMSGRVDRKTKSCPVSTKSSPIHHENGTYNRETSIRAAIAHCKRSFGQASDLGF